MKDGRADKEKTRESQQAPSRRKGQQEQTRNAKASGLGMWLSWVIGLVCMRPWVWTPAPHSCGDACLQIQYSGDGGRKMRCSSSIMRCESPDELRHIIYIYIKVYQKDSASHSIQSEPHLALDSFRDAFSSALYPLPTFLKKAFTFSSWRPAHPPQVVTASPHVPQNCKAWPPPRALSCLRPNLP